jgi:hypothetical protein
MTIVMGIWFGLAGVVSALAGITGLRRVRRLRRDGVQARALRYTLPDGRVLEKLMTAKTAAVLSGERVLIWYDPADPLDVLVHGRSGRASNVAFVVAGAAFAIAGAVIGILAP